MTTKDDNGREPQYWICDACAEQRKWIGPKWPVTCIKGLCGYCTRTDETYLTPIVDFDRPGQPAIWD